MAKYGIYHEHSNGYSNPVYDVHKHMGARIHGKIWLCGPWPLSRPYLEVIRPLATHLFPPVVDTCFLKTRLLNLTTPIEGLGSAKILHQE